jgi:hypothetical protein
MPVPVWRIYWLLVCRAPGSVQWSVRGTGCPLMWAPVVPQWYARVCPLLTVFLCRSTGPLGSLYHFCRSVAGLGSRLRRFVMWLCLLQCGAVYRHYGSGEVCQFVCLESVLWGGGVLGCGGYRVCNPVVKAE